MAHLLPACGGAVSSFYISEFLRRNRIRFRAGKRRRRQPLEALATSARGLVANACCLVPQTGLSSHLRHGVCEPKRSWRWNRPPGLGLAIFWGKDLDYRQSI